MATLTCSAVDAHARPTHGRSDGRSDRASTLRLCVEALRDGLAASRRYQQLQASGVPRAEAAARAINETT